MTLYSPQRSFSAPTKRRVFFSFHFDDIMRVNNVRNVWKIDHPDAQANRSFYDSSLWEARQLEGPEALKRLIREGVAYTPAVCVLIGTATWSRRWVRYEVARSVIDGRGLLAVHLNNINHHQTRRPHPVGPNPLDAMGIAVKTDGQLYLCEWSNGQWQWYADYTQSITKPAYIG